jgi:hypothetical protein
MIRASVYAPSIVNVDDSSTNILIDARYSGRRIWTQGGELGVTPVALRWADTLAVGDEGLVRWVNVTGGQPVFVSNDATTLYPVGSTAYDCISVPGGEIHWLCVQNDDGESAVIQISGAMSVA